MLSNGDLNIGYYGTHFVFDFQIIFIFIFVFFRFCSAVRVSFLPDVQEGVLNVVMGCNDGLLSDEHTICTAASCTTNCLAPVVKVRFPRKSHIML